MASWADLRRYCRKNLVFVKEGSNHTVYRHPGTGELVIVSRGSGEIGKHKFAEILKNQLGITKDEFNKGL